MPTVSRNPQSQLAMEEAMLEERIHQGIMTAIDLLVVFELTPINNADPWRIRRLSEVMNPPSGLVPDMRWLGQSRRTVVNLRYYDDPATAIPSYIFSRVERGEARKDVEAKLKRGPKKYYTHCINVEKKNPVTAYKYCTAKYKEAVYRNREYAEVNGKYHASTLTSINGQHDGAVTACDETDYEVSFRQIPECFQVEITLSNFSEPERARAPADRRISRRAHRLQPQPPEAPRSSPRRLPHL